MRSLAVFCFASCVVALIVLAVNAAGRIEVDTAPPQTASLSPLADEDVTALNEYFRKKWTDEELLAAEPASDLTILRRLSLALHGTVPSMEEIRRFEADDRPDRLTHWTQLLLTDQRYYDYFSERLVRSLAGTEEGPFILFRRDRLAAWLSSQLRDDVPWADVVTQLISAEGLWTDRPATNFITVARVSDEEGIDENKLAGRTVRTFLGQRIDCAQCHNHPFDERWKRADFEGLAAWFSQARVTFGGITDQHADDEEPAVYRVIEPGTDESEGRVVAPVVPFHPEWLPKEGSLRKQLAAWVVHPENRRFERATANRIWGLMFGRPLHDPVDDLPHPENNAERDALDILGTGFRKSGGRLSDLIRLISQSSVFRCSSEHSAESAEEYDRSVQQWAAFPLVRLRPEQVIGSMIQAGSLRTIDQNSHLLTRLIRYGNENDFLKEYGDLGEEELLQHAGTIPQALLRMNGRFTNDLTKVDTFTAPSQIMQFSKDDTAIIENCFLACLSRRPDTEELSFFLKKLAGEKSAESNGESAEDGTTAHEEISEGNNSSDETESGIARLSREELIQDLYWTLFNTPEFSWNH